MICYVDTSILVAVAFEEPVSKKISKRLNQFTAIYSANLLEAEFRAACKREELADDIDEFLSGVSWVYPDRPLTHEFEQVLELGFLRGADLWHVATALYLSPKTSELHFLSADKRQLRVAQALGFK